MKEKTRNSSISRIISNFLLIIAIVILNYPIASDIYNGYHTSMLYNEYQNTVSDMNFDKTIKDIELYNCKVSTEGEHRFYIEKGSEEYKNLLSVQSGGIMGYLTANSAGIVSVPVYHFTSTESLQVGAGHLAGSSLPSAGSSVHTVISGHSGMSGMKMFSQLTSMKPGDVFYLNYLNRTLSYMVDNIETVSPEDMSNLEIISGENHCSLITCVPLGLNTHRLIVRGTLTGMTENDPETVINKKENFSLFDRFAKYELIMSGISLFLILLLIKDNFKKKKKNALQTENVKQIIVKPVEKPFIIEYEEIHLERRHIINEFPKEIPFDQF